MYLSSNGQMGAGKKLAAAADPLHQTKERDGHALGATALAGKRAAAHDAHVVAVVEVPPEDSAARASWETSHLLQHQHSCCHDKSHGPGCTEELVVARALPIPAPSLPCSP